MVTREQLRSHIWPNDTFVDFDHALNTSIAKIRLALGDDAEHPTFIETLPRRGYRFIAPVQKPAINEPPANTADLTSTKPNLLRIAAVLATMIALSAIVLWQTSRKRSHPALPSIEAVPLVALQRSQASPAFSPDGNQVAFGGYEGEDGAIYTALVGGDKPLRLTVESGVCCPTWCPYGRQIAFFRFLKEKMIINVISAWGGAERTLYTGTDGFPGDVRHHGLVSGWKMVGLRRIQRQGLPLPHCFAFP